MDTATTTPRTRRIRAAAEEREAVRRNAAAALQRALDRRDNGGSAGR